MITDENKTMLTRFHKTLSRLRPQRLRQHKFHHIIPPASLHTHEPQQNQRIPSSSSPPSTTQIHKQQPRCNLPILLGKQNHHNDHSCNSSSDDNSSSSSNRAATSSSHSHHNPTTRNPPAAPKLASALPAHQARGGGHVFPDVAHSSPQGDYGLVEGVEEVWVEGCCGG